MPSNFLPFSLGRIQTAGLNFGFRFRCPSATVSVCSRRWLADDSQPKRKKNPVLEEEMMKFSETTAYYGPRDEGRDSSVDMSLLKPAYVASYYDSFRFWNIRFASIALSLATFLLYIAFIREPNEVDQMWEMDMRLVYVLARKKLVKEQIGQERAAGRSVIELQAQLADIELEESKLREEDANKKKKEEGTRKAGEDKAKKHLPLAPKNAF